MDLLTDKYIDADEKLLNPYALDIEPEEGDRSFVTGHVAAKGVDVDRRRVRGMTSTESIDRYEEIIKAVAFQPWLKAFMQNPQFLARHSMGGFGQTADPKSIGQWAALNVIKDEGLEGEAQFLEPGDELADKYWNRYRQRAMRAFSVGGIVHEWAMVEFELSPGVKKRLRVLTNFELIEISAVEVPANRDALVKMLSAASSGKPAKAAGFDITELVGEIRQLREKLSPAALVKEINDTLTKIAADPAGPFSDIIREAVDVAVRSHDPGRTHDGLAPDSRSSPSFDDELKGMFV